ncbi:hypothetical protein JGI10_00791 [Candidatus Kryptonium thompsonii]|nr:hypothetical protein JGI10_00791 [Candidatus Kryptonium thompsoni]
MFRNSKNLLLFLFFVVFLLTGCSTYQVTKPDYLAYLDTVKAGQFDTGKMWTFDYPPIDYFKKTYNFTPTSDWFEKSTTFCPAASGMFCVICFRRWTCYDEPPLCKRST